MKRPSFIYRYIIIACILTIPPILSTHYGSIFLGKENGILLGFVLVFLVCLLLVGNYTWMVGEMMRINEV